MDNNVLIALIAFLGSAIGTIGGIVASSKLTTFRLQALEEQVKRHNSIVERTYLAENNISVLQNDVRETKHGISALNDEVHKIDSRVSKLEGERG